MTNEIILSGNASLGKSRLGSITNNIIRGINAGIATEKDIAASVFKVDNEELAVKAGFPSTADWAARFLDWSKSKTSRTLSIYRRFGEDAAVWAAFTMSQMQEMYKSTDDELEKAGIIPLMRVADIREALKKLKEIVDIGSAEETEPTEETEPAEETEPEQAITVVKVTHDLTEALATVTHYVKAGARGVTIEQTRAEKIEYTISIIEHV